METRNSTVRYDNERPVKPEELPAELAEDVARGKEVRARSRLLDYLEQVHATVPEVPEEEVEQAIREAIQAVRAKV